MPIVTWDGSKNELVPEVSLLVQLLRLILLRRSRTPDSISRPFRLTTTVDRPVGVSASSSVDF